MDPARRPAAQRWLAVLLGLVLLLAQLGDALHQARVRHVRCAEHGEWIHVAEVAPSSARVSASAASASEERGPAVRPAPGAAESHDHCVSVSPQRERWLALLGPPVLIVPATAQRASPARDRAPAPDDIELLRLAPKHSPPCS